MYVFCFNTASALVSAARRTNYSNAGSARPAAAATGSSASYGLLLGASSLAMFSAYNMFDDKRSARADATPLVGVPGTVKERTFIAVKPDGVQRGLVGEVIKRFEARGYKLVAVKVVVPTEKKAKEHYDDLKSKPFFGGLVKYFSSGPVVAMVWEGRNVIANGRKLVGATNPAAAEPGSIRGDLCIDIGRNIIHGSDAPDSAKAEIALWFTEAEVANYDATMYPWIFEGK